MVKKRGKFDSAGAWEASGQGPEPRQNRQASVASDVGVPFLQALITGALVGAACVAALVVAQVKLPLSPVAIWAALTVLVAAGVRTSFLCDLRKILYQRIEERWQVDLDGDGQIGQGPERLVFVNGAKIAEEARAARSQEELSEFARFVRGLETRGTSGDAWFQEIGRKRYSEYRDILIQHGLARWKSVAPNGRPYVNKGWELTTPAETILRALEE